MLSPSDEPPLIQGHLRKRYLEVLYRRKDGSACCDHAPGNAYADRPVLKKPFDIQN
jgi:hypothetical protein